MLTMTLEEQKGRGGEAGMEASQRHPPEGEQGKNPAGGGGAGGLKEKDTEEKV